MMLLETKRFPHLWGTLIESGQQAKEFLDAFLLPNEIAIVKIEAYANRDTMEVKGHALTYHFVKKSTSYLNQVYDTN